MSLKSVVWAYRLTGLPPIAKLVAIDLASVSGSDEIGRRTIEELADFVSSPSSEVIGAISQLRDFLQIEIDGDLVKAAFPIPPAVLSSGERLRIEKGIRDSRHCQLYVINKGSKIKIGITRRLKARLSQLGSSYPATQTVIYKTSGTYAAMRRAEIIAHQALSDYALGGEYFDVTDEQAVDAVKRAVQAQTQNVGR